METAQSNGVWVRAALERHGAALTRYAARITGDADSARDVVQDTFVRLCGESPESLEGRLAPWLFTVCRNRALDMHRKLHRLVPLPEDTADTTPDPHPSPAIAVEQRETAEIALGLLARLPESQREVVRLKFQAGLSYAEIAEVTQLSVSNVGFLLHTALKTLRQGLARSR